MIDDNLPPPQLSEIPQYGIWHACLAEAAFMIAYDQWYSFGTPSTAPDAKEEQLRTAVEGRASIFRELLVESVEKGRLVASPVRRKMDGKIRPDCTYIRKKDVERFLAEYGYRIGDHLNDWIYNDDHLIEKLLCDEIKFLRAEEAKSPDALDNLYIERRRLANRHESPSSHEHLMAQYRALTIESLELRKRIFELESIGGNAPSVQAASRRERNLERTIGALVECILGGVGEVDKHPSFSGQTNLCERLSELFDGYEGLSLSTLTNFPVCNVMKLRCA